MQTLNITDYAPALGTEIRIQIRPNGGYHIVINCDGNAKIRAADVSGSSVLSPAGGQLTLNNVLCTNSYWHLICVATGATSVNVEWNLVHFSSAVNRYLITVT
jgi:hypothetical protein